MAENKAPKKYISPDSSKLQQSLIKLLKDYNDFNPAYIDVLDDHPTAHQFMQYVSKNRPFKIQRGATQFAAFQKWTLEYLIKTMGSSLVQVDITPDGMADSPKLVADLEAKEVKLNPKELMAKRWVLAKPLEAQMCFDEAMRTILQNEQYPSGHLSYRGSAYNVENDNIKADFPALLKDVPETFPFVAQALNTTPDAINFWLGNSQSITALHKDPYENIFVQIAGKKHVTLLPPIAAPCVREETVYPVTYSCQEMSSGSFKGVDWPNVKLDSLLGSDATSHPFPTWDPDDPTVNASPFSQYAEQIQINVTVEAGDILYIPAMWYHKIKLESGDEGYCCSVNYWYDMEYQGSLVPLCNFIRDLCQQPEESQD